MRRNVHRHLPTLGYTVLTVGFWVLCNALVAA
jgi:hypothetical protein